MVLFLAELCHDVSTGAGCVQIYRNRSPIYTMRPQIYVRPMFQTPAPNAYRAEDVVMHKPTIFKKSFGEKHSVFAGAMVNKVTSQCRMVPYLNSALFTRSLVVIGELPKLCKKIRILMQGHVRIADWYVAISLSSWMTTWRPLPMSALVWVRSFIGPDF